MHCQRLSILWICHLLDEFLNEVQYSKCQRFHIFLDPRRNLSLQSHIWEHILWISRVSSLEAYFKELWRNCLLEMSSKGREGREKEHSWRSASLEHFSTSSLLTLSPDLAHTKQLTVACGESIMGLRTATQQKSYSIKSLLRKIPLSFLSEMMIWWWWWRWWQRGRIRQKWERSSHSLLHIKM